MQFVSAIESPLKAAGYNVQVIDVSPVAGSIVVTSTTEFLDGSMTGASDFVAALGDSNSVAALFPASVYGVATVESVKTAAVTNPSKLGHRLGFALVQMFNIVMIARLCRWSRSFWNQCCSLCQSSLDSGSIGCLRCAFSVSGAPVIFIIQMKTNNKIHHCKHSNM